MEVLSAIVSGVVTKLAEYAVTPVDRQVGYVIQYNSNLHNLRTKVQNLKDRRQYIIDVNWLTKEVDELTGEVDTFLENEGHAKAKCFHGFCPNPILYYQLSKKAKELVQKIEPYEKTEFPPQEICIVRPQDYLDFTSRASVVEKIMKELKNPNTNKIGVSGVGGVGKTTLAEEVYRQANEEKLFDGVVIIVDVKNYSDPARIQKEKYIERIQNEIAEKLNIDLSECRTEKGRARHLWHKLIEKKILVILDDVWERIELEEVGMPPTCNILFTSRSREVLFSKMDIQKEFCLHALGEEESWSLFEKMAGGVVKNELIREIAIQLSKKCGGLPILIVTVARALRNSNALYEWKDALRRLTKLDVTDLEEKALSTLEWSYNQLDAEELKSLFLLCGILASSKWDNFITLDDCFKYSMGLGLLKNVDTMEEAQNAFHSLIKKLQNYCLLLEHPDGLNYEDVRMHELLHKVAIRIARRDKHALLTADDEEEFKAWPKKGFFRKCTMICLHQSKMPKLPQVPWECRKLKLLIFDCYHDSVALPCKFFEDMKKLKVLDLSALPIPSLPSSLQFLTNLQTLCIDRCVLEDITLVGQLRNLEILSFLKSKVKQLPEEIRQLTRLRLLDLTGCSELVLIPPNVLSSLKSLEDLRIGGNSFRQWEAEGTVGAKRTTNASLSELEQLSKLTALDIHIPDASVLPSGLFLQLKRYHVLIGKEWKWLSFDDSFNTLKLKLATSNQLDRGLEMLVKRSEHLYLDVMEGVNDIFHLLNSDGYQQLKHLQVQNNAEITYVINHNVFQKLQSLKLMNLPKLVSFSSNSRTAVATTTTDEQLKTDGECKEIILENEIGSPVQLFKNGEIVMPNLTILTVDKCDGLRFLLSSSMAKSLVQLKHLEVHNCQIMEEIVSTRASGEEMNTDGIFCKLNHLQLQHLPQLTRFCVGNYIEFPSLEILHVEDCTKLETFIFDHAMIKSEETDSKDNLETPGPYFLFDDKVGLPRLQTLIVHDLPKLMTIWHEQLAPDSFCRLKTVDVQRCSSLINIFGASILGRLNALDTLKLRQCQSLRLVFEQGGINAEEEDDTSITPSKLPEYYQNLVSVKIDSCESLRDIFPTSVARGLQQLRKLSVKNCVRVEEIVAMEGLGMTTPKFEFPNATSVNFQNLPRLASFYPGMHASVWPLLEDLTVWSCDNVEIFALEFSRFQVEPELGVVGTAIKQPLFLIEKGSFSNLEKLHFYSEVGTMKNWWSRLPAEFFSKLKSLGSQSGVFQSGFPQNLPHLEELGLYGFEKEVFVHEGISIGEIQAVGTLLPHLKSLWVVMPELMNLGKENAQPVIPNLEVLGVLRCGKLKNLRSSAISFQNLKTLKVEKCHGLEYLTTYSIAQSLTQLKEMEVKDCQGLMEIVADSNQDDAAVNEIAFMRLQRLELSGLPSLRRFCSGNCLVKIPSLDTLVVTDCLVKLSVSPDRVLLTDFNPERFLQNFNNLDNLVLHGDHKEIFFHEENSGEEIHAVVTLPHLTSLKLSEMNMLMHLGKENSQPIIPNLEILEVSLCGKLKNLSSPSISFQNLKTLKAIGCQGLEYLITSSIAQSLMQLTHLEVKDCERLVQIVGSSSEDEAGNEIAFNRLEHLELSGLPSLQCFFSGTMLSHQFTICNEIEKSGTKENLDSAVQYFLFDKKVGLPRLETLIVHDLHKLMTIWHEQLAQDSFCRLKTVDVQRCSSLINIFGASILGRLNALDTLKLRQCQSLRLVFEHGGINAEEGDDTSITPSELPEYCQNLVSVEIDSCESLRNIFPASVARGLQQLRKLSVENCVRVEEIVAMEGLGMTTPEFVFPNATSVKFQNLPRLSSFYPGMHASVWPLLGKLQVESCDNVEIFALEFSRFQAKPELGLVGTAIKQPLFLIEKGSFSNLEYLHLYSMVGAMKNWWSPHPAELFTKLKSLWSQSHVFQSGFLQNLPHLESLLLYGFEKEIFVHQPISSGEIQAVGTLLPHLKSLRLFNMPQLMNLGKENSQPVLPNLEVLRVKFCGKLKNLRSSAISFQNLKTLEVLECHELEYLIPCSIAQSLMQLEHMEVKDCRGLVQILAYSNKDDDGVNEIAFMRLQHLELSGLPSLQGFCSGKCIVKIPFLDTLTITECLIDMKISPDKVLLSNSKTERLKLIKEEAKDHDKPEGSDTTRTQAT